MYPDTGRKIDNFAELTENDWRSKERHFTAIQFLRRAQVDANGLGALPSEMKPEKLPHYCKSVTIRYVWPQRVYCQAVCDDIETPYMRWFSILTFLTQTFLNFALHTD